MFKVGDKVKTIINNISRDYPGVGYFNVPIGMLLTIKTTSKSVGREVYFFKEIPTGIYGEFLERISVNSNKWF